MKQKSKICTTFINPPIPIRGYDWEAVRADYDEGDPIGYGASEQEAVDDLIEAEKDWISG